MRWLQVAAISLSVFIGAMAHAQQCNLSDPSLVKPDLKALTPLRARVVQREGARRLFFTTKIANLGRGPLEIRGKTMQTAFGPVTQATQVLRRSNGTTCNVDVGTFEFHQSHNHFHLNDFAEYQLRKDDPFTGPIVARASKISFCLTDIEPQRGFSGQRQVDANCAVQEGVQGISSGWADVYDDFYPEQYIDLDICRTDGGVPPGQYWLVNVADPDDILIEDKDDFVSNSGVVSVNIPARIGNQPIPHDPSCAPPAQPPTRTATFGVPPTAVRTMTPTAVLRTPTPTQTPRGVVRPPRPTRKPRPTRAPRPTRPPRVTITR